MKEIYWLLFLAKGRLNRKGFWLYFGPLLLLMAIGSGAQTEPETDSFAVVLVTLVFLAWTQFSVIIKRYHDLGKSGWWSLLWIIPIINIWVLIECGFFPGNTDENKYGNYRFLDNA